MKENLKPCAYKQYELHTWVSACLLKNEPASYGRWKVKGLRPGAEAKASLKRAWSAAVDPKPGDLSMARVKRG